MQPVSLDSICMIIQGKAFELKIFISNTQEDGMSSKNSENVKQLTGLKKKSIVQNQSENLKRIMLAK